MDLTAKQERVYDELPNTRRNIADHLGISVRAVRYRMSRIEDNTNIEFEKKSDGKWHVKHDDKRGNRLEPSRVKTFDKAQNTKDVHDALTEIEKDVKEALANTDPVVSEYERTPGKSTLVLPHSDSHVGAVVQGREDVSFYSADEAEEVIVEYFDRGIQAARDRGGVEDVVVVLNGDHLDGEGVYPGQRHEQEDNLRNQQRKAGRTYIEQLLKLSEEFENVWVYAVPGNHGNIDQESTTNADNMLYDFIEAGLDYSSAENINFELAGPAGYVNFEVRGWDYFCRHGNNFLQHVGTSSGIRRAQDWWMKHQFDLAIRSHYHTVLYETIGDEIPIVMTGSPSPPSTFAESRGAAGGRCGVYWFATENKKIDGFQPIRFKS